MKRGLLLTSLTAVVVCSLIPTPGHTQEAASTVASTRRGPLGYLGLESLKCNCTLRTDDDGNRTFIFRSNPVVLGVLRGSPADGSLVRGDTITAIDGYALLSTEGARRFASIRPGQRLTLNASRGRARMTLLVRAGSIASADDRSPGFYAREAGDGVLSYDFPAVPAIPAIPTIPAIPATPAPFARPARRATRAARVFGMIAPLGPVPPVSPVPAIAAIPPVPPVPESPASPAGWFGFSIRCNQCGWSLSRGDDSPVWESSSPPTLAMVASEGPAGRAGLVTGDRITHIDGISILTPGGARRFGGVRPGQTIRLTVRRDGKSLTRELTLATRPEVRAARAVIAPMASTPRIAPARRELRYAGELDNVTVEVWSAGGPTVERVGDTMVITVGGSVVRLKVKKD